MMKLAVMGDPIEHSLSPLLHQQFAQKYGYIIDYQKIRVNQQELPHALKDFWAQGGVGLNLTSPLKEIALTQCDELDETAKHIGSVNTLHRVNGKTIGYNTDPDGFLSALNHENINVKNKSVLVLGAGGAAKAVIYSLLLQDADVSLYNRTLQRAVDLKKIMQPLGNITLAEKPMPYDIVINTLTRDATLGVFQQAPMTSANCAFNLNYHEFSSPFLQFSRQLQIDKYVSGEGMLLGQAAKAFGIWTGAVVSFDILSLTQIKTNGG